MSYAKVSPDVPRDLFVPSLEDRDIAAFPRIVWPGMEVSQGTLVLGVAAIVYFLVKRKGG